MRLAVAFLAVLALVIGGLGFVLGIRATDLEARHSTALQQLVLGGKSASAVAARTNSRELQSLLLLERFDHTQTQNNQRELRTIVREVEAHLDHTIKTAIAQIAGQPAPGGR